ncbi:epsin-1 isoform X2 [Toxorhynchites rutilus septentrionalis]|uniref:epsin-1 isoform X2 n=1 Tax=Toxorhynchites rutilus septentrionalis TaxID=329112 RepID=UPI002479CE54|nr:epsin-1 isoform X2 [Toxorhynchites rutilus septentrionalis]
MGKASSGVHPRHFSLAPALPTRRMKRNDTQMNVAGIRRNIKNLAHNYSDAQIKVREATSNDPWGPSSTIMAEIADLTYNVVAFSEIMQMIWKRTNDHGKNWRHVHKALLLLEYLINTGTEKVAQQCKENIYAIQTLKDFQYMEEGKDQGMHVREKAKQLVALLKDDEKLKNERARALKAKERFARTASGFGSDGSIDGPTHKDSANWSESESKPVSEIEFVRPQTVGEEELQLQLAMAMSREEAEQEEQKRRSDDVRLQLALSQSEQDFKKDPMPESSALVDLLDISFGAAGISSPSQQPRSSNSADPWGLPAPAGGSRQQLSNFTERPPSAVADPWSRTSSPPVVDPWLNSAAALPPPASKPPLLGAAMGGGQLDAWAPVRTQSPSVTSGSSAEGWLQNGTGASAAAAGANGNVDPWLGKVSAPSAPATEAWQPKRTTPVPTADPWQPTTNVTKQDPWAPVAGGIDGSFALPAHRPSPVGAITSPASDLDEFDIITKRSINSNAMNNNLANSGGSLLDDLDPLSSSNTSSSASNSISTPSAMAKKTPASFLGENSSLVNLDNLIKPVTTSTAGPAAYNPFGDSVPAQATQKNLFQQNQPQVPSINQLKQSPFPVTLNQDPWAPVSSTATAQFDENEPKYGMLYSSTNNVSSLGLTEEIERGFDANSNAIDCNNNNTSVGDGTDDVFNTNFLDTTYGGKLAGGPRPFDELAYQKLTPAAFPTTNDNNNAELGVFSDFGATNSDRYDVDYFKANNNNINNNAPWMNQQSSNPFLS